MASLFSKRLTCFYCGQRSARSHRGSVRNFRCEHCEADNFFDEVGTDPFLEFIWIILMTVL